MLWVTFSALLPTMGLIMIVLGTILMGVATPTEAAACGAWVRCCWRWPIAT